MENTEIKRERAVLAGLSAASMDESERSTEISMEELAALYPQVKSVSIVPVGLTRYREGLYPLRPYHQDEARNVVAQVEAFGDRCVEQLGSRMFWCSDEFYLQAGLDLPADAFYEEYGGEDYIKLSYAENQALSKIMDSVKTTVKDTSSSDSSTGADDSSADAE